MFCIAYQRGFVRVFRLSSPPERAATRLGGALLVSLVACGSEDPAAFVEPVYGSPCQFELCSGHGACQAGAEGGPECDCDEGYAGVRCSLCAPGFHLDARQLCVGDRGCAEQDRDPCGAHGVCQDDAGTIVCECAAGYEGARCELCVPGYGSNAFGECLQLFITADGGLQPAPEMCSDSACGGHGHCSDEGGSVSCSCFPGYDGARCQLCAPGFGLRGGRCVDESAAACNAGECGSCERFDGVTGFPERPDMCLAGETELDEIRLLSQGGFGTVWLCGPTAVYGLASQHVVLEAGSEPATLEFELPIAALSFDYGARGPEAALALDILGDDRVIDSITAEREANGTKALSFEPPIRVLGLRSKASRMEQIGIDNLVYEPALCE